MRITTLETWEKFSKCEENSLYASNKNIFKNWQVGEVIVILIGREGVATMLVEGIPYLSYEMICDNDIYDWRIPLGKIEKYENECGKSLNENLREFLKSELGRIYGSMLCNRNKASDSLEKGVEEIISTHRKKDR